MLIWHDHTCRIVRTRGNGLVLQQLDKHLRKAFRDIKRVLQDGAALSRTLVHKHAKDTIRNWKAGKDVKAFSTSTDSCCHECKGCLLHCKDYKGKWRPAPSSHSSGDSDSSSRNVLRDSCDSHASSRDFKALADALPHSYPATTERDGNTVIADAKKAVNKAYLLHVAANMTIDDEAGVTDDSQDYFDDSAPIYSRPGNSD
jgi:hypothetical protein